MDSSAPRASAARAIDARARTLGALRALRPHQWAKNVLVFAPILAAHRASDRPAVLATVLAFAAFSVVASAVYVLNDLADLEADRLHPRKRERPFAAGVLPPAAGLALAAPLLVLGGAVAAALPPAFRALLAAYFALTLAYSCGLKKWPLVDVFLLGALYTSRIFAGAFATGIPISEWLASFSMFLFLSLAFLKRASELGGARTAPARRGYLLVDREAVFSMGTTAGYLSALVLALYVSSEGVRRLYARPALLWALCPLVLYWVSRLWLRAGRSEVHDDPVVFALTDRVTWAVAVLGGALVLAATGRWP